MPTPTVVRVTSSWDDGHSNNVRVAEILRRHGGKGTFFIYPVNYVLYTKDPSGGAQSRPVPVIVPHERFIARLPGHGNRRARFPASGYARADAAGVIGSN